jgi:hypothetical protein
MNTLLAYCVHCRVRTEMVEPEQITLKNDKPAVRGRCSTCKTPTFRVGVVLS